MISSSMGLFLKNGSQIRFWEDNWLGNRTLYDQYLGLYNIARRKQDTMAQVLGTNQLNISWGRGHYWQQFDSVEYSPYMYHQYRIKSTSTTGVV